MQLNQPEDALGYYETAFGLNTNDFTTPRFLFKAATTALELGQNDKATQYLNRIQDEFKNSDYANQVDLYLGKAQAATN